MAPKDDCHGWLLHCYLYYNAKRCNEFYLLSGKDSIWRCWGNNYRKGTTVNPLFLWISKWNNYSHREFYDSNFRVGLVLLFVAAIVSFIYIGRNAIGRIKVWYNTRHQVSINTIKVSVHEPGSSTPSHTLTFRINNQSHNPEVISNKYLILFLLITFLILVPLNVTIAYCFQMNVAVFTLRFQYLIVCFSLATYPYCNNQSLRKFVFEYYSECLC